METRESNERFVLQVVFVTITTKKAENDNNDESFMRFMDNETEEKRH